MSDDPQRRWALPLLLVCAAVVWLPVAAAGFVWDDQGLVVGNLLTPDLANLPRFFAIDLWASTSVGEGVSGYYRPLMLVSLALDRAAWGLSPVGHHLHGLAWHLLAVAAVFRLLEAPLGWRPALLAATVFAVHPVQVEAVTWVAARNDPMAAALGLWALVCVAAPRPGRGRLAAAFGLALLAGLAKESVVLLPALLLIVDLARGQRPRWVRYAPLLGGIAVVVGMRLLAGVGGATWPDPIGWRLLLARSPDVAALVGRLWVAPWPLSAGYALEWLARAPLWHRAVGTVGLVAVVAATIALGRRLGRRALLGLPWALVAGAPVVLPLADKGLFGDRYLYLGMVGMGALAGMLAGRRALGVAVAVALPSAVMVQLRLTDWTDERALWTQAVAVSPNPYTYAGLGHVHRMAGEDEQALAYFVAALDDERPDRSVCAQAVGTALALQRPALAAQLGHWAEPRGCGGDGAFVGQFAIAMGFLGEWDDARALSSRVIDDPTGRKLVAAIAVALHDDDPAQADLLASGAPDPQAVLDQARRVVAAAPR